MFPRRHHYYKNDCISIYLSHKNNFKSAKRLLKMSNVIIDITLSQVQKTPIKLAFEKTIKEAIKSIKMYFTILKPRLEMPMNISKTVFLKDEG